MNSINRILLIGICCGILCIIHKWVDVTTFLVYTTLMWFLMIILSSTWLSFIMLKSTLTAKAPSIFEPFIDWLWDRMEIGRRKRPSSIINDCIKVDKDLSDRNVLQQFLTNIDNEFIGSWYYTITDDTTFRMHSKMILQKLLKIISKAISAVNDIRLSQKVADIVLLHLKEYRRSLRRIGREKVKKLEDAYKCLHPGSRGSEALEHNMHRLVTSIASEFLQLELTNSLPCKLLISVLSKQVLTSFLKVTNPTWIFPRLLGLLKRHHSVELEEEKEEKDSNLHIISESKALNGISAIELNNAKKPESFVDRSSGFGENLLSVLKRSQTVIWSEPIEDPGDEQISPVYEEPVDFATTIARLRNLLQEKSTATSPILAKERCYEVGDGSQFRNLAIPWTEYHTSSDGSQQLLYCIQFDDIEQHGEDIFETTTATVKRKYSDFVQLHASLERISDYVLIISEINLPDGGRSDMEFYLRTLCLKLGDSPVQIRHFLRPSIGADKKADAVVPRFDRILAKTVTGVFNTLKTVVPGFEIEEEDFVSSALMPLADTPWRFIEDMKSISLSEELKQLVAERIDYCDDDTAYEAFDTIEEGGDSESFLHWWEAARNSPCDEELEGIDEKLGMTCVFVDILCEILAGIGSSNVFRQEAIVRWFKLFFGNLSEEVIHQKILGLFTNIQSSFEKLDVNDEIVDLDEKVVEEAYGRIPKDLKMIFGKNDLTQMIKFLIDSCKNKRINMDIGLQVLDAGVSELLAASKSQDDSLS